MVKLSKTESKCRKKLFAERHYKKVEQKLVDAIAAEGLYTYKEMYKCHYDKKETLIFITEAILEATVTLSDFVFYIQDLAKAFRALGILSKIDEERRTYDGR